MNRRVLKFVLFASSIIGLSWLINEVAKLNVFEEDPRAHIHTQLGRMEEAKRKKFRIPTIEP